MHVYIEVQHFERSMSPFKAIGLRDVLLDCLATAELLGAKQLLTSVLRVQKQQADRRFLTWNQ